MDNLCYFYLGLGGALVLGYLYIEAEPKPNYSDIIMNLISLQTRVKKLEDLLINKSEVRDINYVI